MSDLDEFLGRSPSQTRGTLLELARRQTAAREPRDLMAQWQRDGSVAPGEVDQRTTVALDALVLDAAEGYEARVLSPVAPLGATSVVAPTSQDRVLSTTRATEVVSDPTNVLALESAHRLAADPDLDVRLCTSHQSLRMQPVDDAPGRTRHFRLFAMSDAGRGRADDGFEVAAVVRQLTTFDRFFDACAARGHELPDRRAIIRTSAASQVLGDRVTAALNERLPHVELVREPLESDYYHGLRVGFGARDRSGEFVELGDLGVFDWVARLTHDARQRFVASGLGIQLVPLLFSPTT